MFGRKSLPLGVLVMLLVLALASLGIGYGLWSKTLYINGTVKTGSVDAELSLEAVGDNEVEKDVGKCDASLLDLDDPPDGQPEKIRVEVINAYPSYACWVTFDVHAKGSIPVLVYRPIFTVMPPEKEVNFYVEKCYEDGTQLHASERVYCTLIIHVKQDAVQNAGRGEGYPPAYVFEGTIEARQFNEPRPPL